MNNKKIPNTNKIIKLKNNSKTTQVNTYNLIPGLDLLYNKFNVNEPVEMEYYKPKNKIIEFNYCHAGRYDCSINENKQVFLGEGEMEVNIANINRANQEFPLGYYEGISVIIDIQKLTENLNNTFFKEISEKILKIYNYLLENDFAVLIKSNPKILKIFREFYEEQNQNNILYLKLKVLEIISLLQVIPYNRNKKNNEYFNSEVINKIKKAHDEVVHNLETKITLNELSEKYKISLTIFKRCFKKVYGSPYYSYLKKYKAHRAIHYLEESELSITEIALKVGYENPSKFISAFKELVGYTPREYRNKNIQLEHLGLFGVEVKKQK